jgi:chromosome segregation ATPase
MGDVVWSPTGSSISVFNKQQRERVGSLSPSHQACISQICRVRQTETRVVWSYSLLDKSVKIWVKESNAEDDCGELVDKLAAAEQALTAQLKQEHAEAAQRQANAEAVEAELVSQLEHALTSLTTSQLRGKQQTDEAHQLKATLEQVTKQRDAAEQRGAVADDQLLRLRAQVSAHHARSVEEAQALKLEISRLERLLGDAEVEKEALLMRVEALSLRAGVSAEQYAKVQEELVALRSANADAQTEIQRLLQCVSHADRDKTCLEAELARVLHDLRESRATLKEREREAAAGRAAMEQVSNELAAAREREQTMARQLLSLDIFKLDIIARELKEVEDLLHSSYKSFSSDQPAVKGQVSKCKEIVRNIINKCLSETQKLHIGTTVQGHDSSLILDILEALRDMKHTFRPQTRTQAKEEEAPPG